jgi:hypothetical protein
MTFQRTVLVAALIAVMPLAGCKVISAIVTSPSDSLTGTGHAIGGSFGAISTSSGSGPSDATKKSSYVRDVREYVGVFMKDGTGTTQDFQRGVSRIAESHGITHWEAEPATPYAIGQGLREANVSEAEMNAFVKQFGRDAATSRLALEGWREAGS